MAKERRNITLDKDINEKLEHLAKRKGLNVSQFISLLVSNEYENTPEFISNRHLINNYLKKKK